uniref:Uncharacterized protein n=1 Tax=Rhizoctonia solani TaxID=456999 RepID=N0ABW5_9AGAM|nr:hypothetical protein RSOL_m01120 [Rhizoctonia solani]AGK45426.1 hypothetical protein RSOL_m01120 [Rhizoctonia solani]
MVEFTRPCRPKLAWAYFLIRIEFKKKNLDSTASPSYEVLGEDCWTDRLVPALSGHTRVWSRRGLGSRFSGAVSFDIKPPAENDTLKLNHEVN